MNSEDPAGVFGGIICGTQTVTENLPQWSGKTNDKMMCCEGLFYIPPSSLNHSLIQMYQNSSKDQHFHLKGRMNM